MFVTPTLGTTRLNHSVVKLGCCSPMRGVWSQISSPVQDVLPVCCSTRHIDPHRFPFHRWSKASPQHDTVTNSVYGGHAGIYFEVSELRILGTDAERYFFVAQIHCEKCPLSDALLCLWLQCNSFKGQEYFLSYFINVEVFNRCTVHLLFMDLS